MKVLPVFPASVIIFFMEGDGKEQMPVSPSPVL